MRPGMHLAPSSEISNFKVLERRRKEAQYFIPFSVNVILGKSVVVAVKLQRHKTYVVRIRGIILLLGSQPTARL